MERSLTSDDFEKPSREVRLGPRDLQLAVQVLLLLTVWPLSREEVSVLGQVAVKDGGPGVGSEN